MILRIFAIIMALTFLVFAALQYNDPDPHLWIPIYLYVAVLSVMAMNRKASQTLLFISAALFLAGAVYMWPAHWEGVALKNGMKTRFIEEGRESLGLGMCFITLIIYGFAARNKRAVVS